MGNSVKERIEKIKGGETKREDRTDKKSDTSKTYKIYQMNTYMTSRKNEKHNSMQRREKEYHLDYREPFLQKDRDK